MVHTYPPPSVLRWWIGPPGIFSRVGGGSILLSFHLTGSVARCPHHHSRAWYRHLVPATFGWTASLWYQPHPSSFRRPVWPCKMVSRGRMLIFSFASARSRMMLLTFSLIWLTLWKKWYSNGLPFLLECWTDCNSHWSHSDGDQTPLPLSSWWRLHPWVEWWTGPSGPVARSSRWWWL